MLELESFSQPTGLSAVLIISYFLLTFSFSSKNSLIKRKDLWNLTMVKPKCSFKNWIKISRGFISQHWKN